MMNKKCSLKKTKRNIVEFRILGNGDFKGTRKNFTAWGALRSPSITCKCWPTQSGPPKMLRSSKFLSNGDLGAKNNQGALNSQVMAISKELQTKKLGSLEPPWKWIYLFINESTRGSEVPRCPIIGVAKDK